MDKDLERSVKKLERAVEISDEEAMHGERIAGTMELHEELEEKYTEIRKLERQIKVWRQASVIELVILIMILLYACGTRMLQKPLVSEAQEKVMEEAVPLSPVQTISEETIFFNQEVPEIAVNQIESTTTDALTATLSAHETAASDAVNYLGHVCILGEGCPSGVSIYSMESLAEVFGNAKCRYSVNTKPCNEEGHDDGSTRVYDQPIFVNYYDEEGNPESHSYYNAEFLEINLPEGADNLSNHTHHFPYYIEICVYEETDIDMESLIRGIIEDYPTYSDITIEESYIQVQYAWDSSEVRDSIRDRIKEGLSGVAFSLTFGSSIYNTYDSVKEDADGTIICSRNGEKIIPEIVKKYHIEIMNYGYYYLTCAYQNHWY